MQTGNTNTRQERAAKRAASPMKLLMLGLIALAFAAFAVACGTDDETPEPGTDPTATPSEPGAPDPTATPEPSFDAEAYFSGETIRIISPAAPGGGYDVFARMFAAAVPDHLPGSPSVIVENITGSGLLTGLQAAMRSDPDGLTVGQMHPRWAQAHLLGTPVEGFDLDAAKILGSPTFAAAISDWCIRSDVASTWQEIVDSGNTVTSGETAPGNSPGPEFVEAVGGPIRTIYGYGGSSEIMAAFDRGELDGTTRCGSELVLRLYPEWLENQYMVPVFWYGGEPDRDWHSQLGAENVPHVLDVVESTPDQQAAFEAYVALVRAQRVFLLPPNVPDEIYEVWQQAFNDTVEDERFRDAVIAAGYEADYELGTAEQVIDNFELARGLSQESIDLLLQMAGQ